MTKTRIHSAQLLHLLDDIVAQYQQIIGETDAKSLSSERLIEYVVKYYQDIILNMPGNVYWIDKHCRAGGCNQNVLNMLGLKSMHEIIGKTFEDIGRIGNWSAEATQAAKNDSLEVLTTGKAKLNIEDPPMPHLGNGKTVYLLTSRAPLFDSLGNVIGLVGISVDIAVLKNTHAALQMEKEHAQASSKAKSEFIANMSHDLKTPLSSMVGIAELLSERLGGENQEFACSLLKSGRQLLSFLNNCLESFSLDSKDPLLSEEYFNLRTVIDENYDLLQPTVKSKDIAINIHYDNRIPEYLLGNRAGIYRILLNLLGNALKFTPEGAITICADLYNTQPNNQVVVKLTIKDSGIGIAQDKQKIIFERFTRLIPSYKGTYEGSGIGLYIVQKYVKAMNGTISIESIEDQGTQFTVLLPFISQEPLLSKDKKMMATVQSTTKPFNASHTSSLRVLLVEDNVTAQRIQIALLSSMGCQVDTADCGEKALEIFASGQYHLIFMDIGLPGLQGDDTCKQIRIMEQGSSYHTPIIGLTAHMTEEVRQHCLAAGMEEIMNKPLLREQAKQILDHYYSNN